MEEYQKRLTKYNADKLKLKTLEIEISRLRSHISNTYFPYCGMCGKQSCNNDLPINGCFTPK